jgi:hypothetical protein
MLEDQPAAVDQRRDEVRHEQAIHEPDHAHQDVAVCGRHQGLEIRLLPAHGQAAGRGRGRGALQRRGRDVHAVHGETRRGKTQRVASRPAGDVQGAAPRHPVQPLLEEG